MALEARRKRDTHESFNISPNLEKTKHIKKDGKFHSMAAKTRSQLKREIKEQGYMRYLQLQSVVQHKMCACKALLTHLA